ncbi:MAG: class A beta-lactamase [Terricaulis sp.]
MPKFSRRAALIGGFAVASCGRVAEAPKQKSGSVTPQDDPRFAAIERRLGGRLGVAALNTANGATLTHWANERFAMCSSFKWLLAAAVLRAEQEERLRADQHVFYTTADLLPNSPRTEEHARRGSMSIDDLCAAAVEVSDNCGANLLLTQIGGPTQGFTRFVRSIGDTVTRLDRTETALNENAPNDPRDTSTPAAMAQTLQRVLTTDAALNDANREKLIGWMVASETGLTRLRAGLPKDWRAGDKTGASAGQHNATNDVAIAWPPGKPPIVIVCYMSDSTADLDARTAAHAEVARIVAQSWSA